MAATETKEIKIEIPNPYLIGYGDELVGSPEYFKKLNTSFHMTGLLTDLSGTDYYNAVKGKNAAIKSAISEILKDLEQYIESIHLIDASKRTALIGFINSLVEYLNMTEYSAGNQDYKKCIAILNLSDKRTGYKVKTASKTERNNAVKKLYRGSTGVNISLNERFNLVKKAQKEGVAAAGSNKAKQQFLTDLAGKYAKGFFADVLADYLHQYKYNYKGKNNFEIGTDGYIKNYEKKIFGDKISKEILKDRKYKSNILANMKKIAHQVKTDTDSFTSKNIILKEYQDKLSGAKKSMNSLGVNFTYKTVAVDKWVLIREDKNVSTLPLTFIENFYVFLIGSLGSVASTVASVVFPNGLAAISHDAKYTYHHANMYVYADSFMLGHYKVKIEYYSIDGVLIKTEVIDPLK